MHGCLESHEKNFTSYKREEKPSSIEPSTFPACIRKGKRGVKLLDPRMPLRSVWGGAGKKLACLLLKKGNDDPGLISAWGRKEKKTGIHCKPSREKKARHTHEKTRIRLLKI